MVKGILSDMCECLVEQLLNGNKIKLGELGVFSISINCEGAVSKDEFTDENIKAVNILFTPGADFENLRQKAEFKLVASRAAQAAVLKAEKANETTVDLAALKKKDDSSDDGGNDSTADSTDTSSSDSGSGSGDTASGGSSTGTGDGGGSTTPSYD